MAEKAKAQPAIEAEHISINFSFTGKDASGNPVVVSESAGFNLQQEGQVNQTLKEKAYLTEVLPLLLKRVKEIHDPENTEAKAFKSKISSILNA